MLHTSSNIIINIINRSLVPYQQKTIAVILDKNFLDSNLDISTISNSEWDVNNKDLDYANASEPKAIVRSKKHCWQNKALIAIICLYLLGYVHNKNANLLQVVNKYFSFA